MNVFKGYNAIVSKTLILLLISQHTSILDVLLGFSILLKRLLIRSAIVLRTNNRASPALGLMCLLRVGIVDKQLTVLAIAMRQLVCNLDNVESVGRLVEDFIHFLERAVSGFGEEEVDGWDHCGVDDGEDDVGLVANVGKGGGSNHDDEEVEDPV